LIDWYRPAILRDLRNLRGLERWLLNLMQVFHKLEDVPADFGPTIVSVGNFDGVHRAHQAVLRDIAERARQQNAQSVAVTFEPHSHSYSSPRLRHPGQCSRAVVVSRGVGVRSLRPESGPKNTNGMRFERDGHRLGVLLPGAFGDVAQDGLVGAVDAVEVSDADDRGAEVSGDVFEFVEDLHQGSEANAQPAEISQKSRRMAGRYQSIKSRTPVHSVVRQAHVRWQ